jgi:hypothetical protein
MPDKQIRPDFDAGAEFDRQLRTLIENGYPKAAGVAPETFADLVGPLRTAAIAHGASVAPREPGLAPFLLVVTREVVPIEESMTLTTLHGRTEPGFVDHSFEPGSIERFVPTKEAELPDQRAYLLLDVDRGEEFCGVVPADAMDTIRTRERTLLTMEEGIAFVTLFPDALAKNKCFSLAASRCGDRRVPAIWISTRRPKLGWCWEGNPHTWLGMASAAGRIAA